MGLNGGGSRGGSFTNTNVKGGNNTNESQNNINNSYKHNYMANTGSYQKQ